MNSVDNELAVTMEERNLVNFKSMYYQMNAKPDSMSKAFSDSVIIGIDDIIELNNRVKEKISLNYQDDGYIASVTVNLKGKKVLSFSCWEEFQQHSWTETSCVNSISLQWNFNIRVPGYEKPQNHNLVVKITNGLKPEELLNLIISGNIEDFDEVELNTFPIVARIDFIQALFGEELINIVGEWAKGLRNNKEYKNPIILLMRKYRKRIAQYFEYIVFIMTFILGLSIGNAIINSFEIEYITQIRIGQLTLIINIFLILALALWLLRRVYFSIARNIYEKLEEYSKVYVFDITKGDRKIQEKIVNKDKNSGRIILANFIFSLIFNVGCGMIASILI